MEARDWFAVGVRVFGLIVAAYGLSFLLDALLLRLGYYIQIDVFPAYYLIFGIAEVAFGICLMRCSGSLVAFAYPERYEIEDQDEPGPEEENRQD